MSDYIDAFARKLFDYGYATDPGQQQLRTIARLSRWMSRHDSQTQDLDEQVVTQFLQERRRQGCVRHIEPKTLALFLEHLRQEGVANRELLDALRKPMPRG